MKGKSLRFKFLTALGAVAIVLPLVFGAVAEATPAAWNDANFNLVWSRTDKPVQDGLVSRSWMWGPETVPGSPSSEPYAEAPGGTRTVQYFDKSRMEVNDPSGDRSSLWFVTNGLLVREMVSGKVATGDSSYTNHGPATEAVAGDPASVNPDCPTYATFTPIASLNNDNPASPKSGFVNQAIDKAGAVTTWVNPSPSPDPSVSYAYFDDNLKHNIPNVFWDFMNQSGLVYWNGSWQNETVTNWVFAMGFPITEAYWTKARVGGVEKDVLVQLFQRRVLTYTPSNPAGYEVEMGNVGQHYKRWRYDTAPAEDRIAFVSNRSGSHQIWSMKATGGDLKQLTDSAGMNSWPSWSPDNSKIVFQSSRDGNWEIYSMNADGTNQQRLTFDPANEDKWPSWSPNGSRIIWTKDTKLYTMANNGGDIQEITFGGPGGSSGLYSPNGTEVAWTTSLPGNFEVYTANLDGSNLARRTFRVGSSDYPVDWRGDKILFVSNTGAAIQVWSMDDDGGSQNLLSGDTDERAAFSPDGSKVVVQHDTEIYVMNSDGSGPVNITNASGWDGYPDWSN